MKREHGAQGHTHSRNTENIHFWSNTARYLFQLMISFVNRLLVAAYMKLHHGRCGWLAFLLHVEGGADDCDTASGAAHLWLNSS